MNQSDKIRELEHKLSLYETDGIVGLYYTLQRKLNELNQVMRDVTISLDDSQDKTFERFMKSAIECREIAENLKWLRIEFSLSGDEDKDKALSRPLIEQLVKGSKK